MPGRRSGRFPTLASPLTLLAAVEPGYRALNAAKAGLAIDGADYQALERATDALARLATDLGHPGLFATVAPRANLG